MAGTDVNQVVLGLRLALRIGGRRILGAAAVEKQEREVTLSTAFKLAHFYGLSAAEIWRPLFRQIGREMSGAAQ